MVCGVLSVSFCALVYFCALLVAVLPGRLVAAVGAFACLVVEVLVVEVAGTFFWLNCGVTLCRAIALDFVLGVFGVTLREATLDRDVVTRRAVVRFDVARREVVCGAVKLRDVMCGAV